MKKQLTSRERLNLALQGQAVDHLPFAPFLAYVWENFPAGIQRKGQLAFHHLIGADPLWRGAPCPVRAITPTLKSFTYQNSPFIVTEFVTPVGKLRQVHQSSPDGNTNFLVEHPLKHQTDFLTQLWIEENTRFELDLRPLIQHFAGVGCEGLSIGMLMPRGKSAFQFLVEHLVGTEELIYALTDYPETVAALWQQMVVNDLVAVNLAVNSIYDYFLTWEDSGTQNYSPQLYERFISSEIRQWCQILARAGKHYIQHACGHVKDLLLLMRQDGVCAVESLTPPPTGNVTLQAAREQLGAGVGLIGGIDPIQFLRFSEPELHQYVELTIPEGLGGPFILANADSCPPGVTVEKFRQVAALARHYSLL